MYIRYLLKSKKKKIITKNNSNLPMARGNKPQAFKKLSNLQCQATEFGNNKNSVEI